jgi:hypothetical protein
MTLQNPRTLEAAVDSLSRAFAGAGSTETAGVLLDALPAAADFLASEGGDVKRSIAAAAHRFVRAIGEHQWRHSRCRRQVHHRDHRLPPVCDGTGPSRLLDMLRAVPRGVEGLIRSAYARVPRRHSRASPCTGLRASRPSLPTSCPAADGRAHHSLSDWLSAVTSIGTSRRRAPPRQEAVPPRSLPCVTQRRRQSTT